MPRGLDKAGASSVMMPLLGAASAKSQSNDPVFEGQRQLKECRALNAMAGIALGIHDFAPNRHAIREIGIVQWDQEITDMFSGSRLGQTAYRVFAEQIKSAMNKGMAGEKITASDISGACAATLASRSPTCYRLTSPETRKRFNESWSIRSAVCSSCGSALPDPRRNARRSRGRQSSGCPCSIWTPAATPANAAVNDGQPIEVGVKFRSDVDGFVTAMRFYKGAANTGTHVGHLWSASGALLAEATFTNESASGWQEVRSRTPVAITANTTYIASYHADSGFFAIDSGFFSAAGVDSPPLHALQAGVDGPNGVFLYGPSGFPTAGGANNYWVDVVFKTDLGPDTTPPVVLNVTPAANATGVPLATTVRATFSEAIDPASVTASTFVLRDQGGADPGDGQLRRRHPHGDPRHDRRTARRKPRTSPP